MTYAKRITTQMKETIGPMLPKILNLKPSGSLVFKGIDYQHVTRVRNHLYSYFSLNNITRKYRLNRESDNRLRVTCIATVPLELISDQPLEPIEQIVAEHLIEIESEEIATMKARELVALGVVKDEDLVPILDEWRRKQG